METNEVIERAARAHDPEAWLDADVPDAMKRWRKNYWEERRENSKISMRRAFSTLRPGDRLPNGLVVVEPEILPTFVMGTPPSKINYVLINGVEYRAKEE